MEKLLAIDTSAEACSVALYMNGEFHESFEIIPRLHARKLLTMIHDLLAKHSVNISDLNAIAYTRGPGSFTGLRIAAGVVQGMAFGANLPVIPVSTLATLAQGAASEVNEACLVVLDARMNEVYWACYSMVNGYMCLLGKENITRPENITSQALIPINNNWCGVGEGWSLKNLFTEDVRTTPKHIIQDLYPHASDVARLALHYLNDDPDIMIMPEQVLPVYLRDKTAWKAG